LRRWGEEVGAGGARRGDARGRVGFGEFEGRHGEVVVVRGAWGEVSAGDAGFILEGVGAFGATGGGAGYTLVGHVAAATAPVGLGGFGFVLVAGLGRDHVEVTAVGGDLTRFARVW
jgi:hypothetical protein